MTMTAGLPTGSKRPVNCRPPVAPAMRNEVIESPFWLQEYRYSPLGSTVRQRGESPCTQTSESIRSSPLFATAKVAMLLCSRFDTYRYRPSAVMMISDDRLLPANLAGNADTSCLGLKPPFPAS